MGFLIINMNLLLRTVDDDTDQDLFYQSDPSYMGHVNLHHAPGNGAEPIEPHHPRHLPHHSNNHIQGNNAAAADAAADNTNSDHGNQSQKQNGGQHGAQRDNLVHSDSANVIASYDKYLSNGNRTMVAKEPVKVIPVVKVNATVPKLIQELLDGPNNPLSRENASFIKNIIYRINREQKIHNLDK